MEASHEPEHARQVRPLMDDSPAIRHNVASYPSAVIRRKPVPIRNSETIAARSAAPPNRERYSEVSVNEDELELETFDRPSGPGPVASELVLENVVDDQEDRTWTPHTLHTLSLSVFAAYGLLLLCVVVTLHSMSAKHDGLVDDDGPPILYFGWRFMPTLLAVIYTIILTAVLDAVKRTENFARLANDCDAWSSACATVLRVPGPWWNALADSFPRRKNDSCFSHVMLCATSAYMLGVFILSPFSSVLLTSREIAWNQSTTFERIQPPLNSLFQPRLETLEYFQTIGHMLQNVTTSPWVSDGYTVLPFWPSGTERPWGSAIPGAIERWSTEGVIFQSDLVCEPFDLVSGPSIVNYTYTYEFKSKQYMSWTNLTSYRFASESGCEYGFATSAFGTIYGASDNGSMSWVAIEDPWIVLEGSSTPNDNLALRNSTAQCASGEVLLMMTSSPFNVSNRIAAHFCKPKFYTATLPIVASVGTNTTSLIFNETVFNGSKASAFNEINDTAFQESFLNSQWGDYMVAAVPDSRPKLNGPIALLGALYGFKVTNMMSDENLLATARKLKQRAFGQALLTSFQQSSETIQLSGATVSARRRIIAVEITAFTIEAVLGIIVLLLIGTLFFSSPSNRPLGLHHDPAYPNTIASIISSNARTIDRLREVSQLKSGNTKNVLRCFKYKTSQGKLLMNSTTTLEQGIFGDRSEIDGFDTEPRWTPIVLSTGALSLLALTLLAVMVAIAVLFAYSLKYGLYQSAFVYQVTIGTAKDSIGMLEPYSIVPTLLAVIVGLWWGALEGIFRTAQPFVSLAKSPQTSANGSGLSYQSSYLAWAAFRAVSRKHWLLFSVCTGAFFSQVLTVAMSALWQREPFHLTTTVNFSQTLQLREVPYLAEGDFDRWGSFRAGILASVFENLPTNWMYSATLQLSLNASEPPWSSDGWSFVPTILPASVNEVQNRGNDTDRLDEANVNATLSVPAIRGRLACSPIGVDLESKFWLTAYEGLDNASIWNVTTGPKSLTRGWQLGCDGPLGSSPSADGGRGASMINFKPNYTAVALGPDASVGNPYDSGKGNCASDCQSTTVLTSAAPVTCCTLEDDDTPGNASIGYWSPISMTQNTTSNFTVKWIHGEAPYNYQDLDGRTYLMWPEVPQLTMLNCKPIIEAANTTITVDTSTNRVLKYDIEDQPVPYQLAWAEDFVRRQQWPGTPEYTYTYNFTITFGVMFREALLSAAQSSALEAGSPYSSNAENTNDRTFNIRRPGLNVDYMSYSMLSLAGDDAQKLLDHATLSNLAGKTFSTFFQHFASSNVLANSSGGWVYQRPSETLPPDLTEPLPQYNTTRAPSRVLQPVQPIIPGKISQPVEILRMSPVAVGLCLGILFWLLVTSILVIVLKGRYFAPLLRPFDSIADVALMVANSERYLELARLKGASGLQSDKSGFTTRLGWFRTSLGEVKWGIERADDDAGGRFLTEQEVQRLKLGTQRNGSANDSNRNTGSRLFSWMRPSYINFSRLMRRILTKREIG